MDFHLTKELFDKIHLQRNKMRELHEMGEAVYRLYDWHPYPRTMLQEVEQFLQQDVGMVRMDADQKTLKGIEHTMERHPNMKYMCSYTYTDLSQVQRWMQKKEIKTEKEMNDLYMKALEDSKINDSPAKYKENERWTRVGLYKLLHLYSEDGVFFDDMECYGGLPRIVECSLFHLLGRAPTPEETYSEWTFYLQFLIDIGYVKMVGELHENSNL